MNECTLEKDDNAEIKQRKILLNVQFNIFALSTVPFICACPFLGNRGRESEESESAFRMRFKRSI